MSGHRTTVHMSLSVRGALRWPKSRLKGMVRDNLTGRSLTPEQTREWLMDRLAAGVELLAYGDCEGFDPKTGCPGHRETP